MKILIISGTSGIGYSVAKNLYEKGHDVTITTHTEKEKNNLKNKLKAEKINVLKIDVLNDKDLEKIKQIDFDMIWLNQALGIAESILYTDIDKMKKLYEVNVFSSVKIMKIAIKKFIEKKIKGRIFVTSSLAGNISIEYLGLYSSSKIALTEICYILNKELKKINEDIKITILELGAYNTGFNQFMIESINKEIIEQDKKKIKALFHLIERKDCNDLTNEIVNVIDNNKTKLRIRKPFFQSLVIKLYSIIFR